MSSSHRLFSMLAALAFIFCPPGLWPQGDADPTPQRGFLPAGSYAPGQIETVNTVSGDMMLRIPLATLPPGRAGHTYGLNYVYNSKLWDVTQTFYSYAPGAPARTTVVPSRSESGGGDAGWHYGWVYYLDLQTRTISGALNPCGLPDRQSERARKIYRLRLITPDGGQHLLHLNQPGYSDFDGGRLLRDQARRLPV